MALLKAWEGELELGEAESIGFKTGWMSKEEDTENGFECSVPDPQCPRPRQHLLTSFRCQRT